MGGTSKVIFENNKPVEVALKFADGRLCRSQYTNEDQWYFTLAHGPADGMYLDPEVTMQIRNLALKPNERFWIAKWKHAGKGSVARWEVWRGDGRGPFERKLDADGDRSPLAQDLARSLDRVKNTRNGHGELFLEKDEPANTEGARDRFPPPLTPSASMSITEPVTRPIQASATSTPSNPTPPKAQTQLESALCTAICAAKTAQDYARQIGFSVTFQSEDIRAMANTVLIGMQQQNGRAA